MQRSVVVGLGPVTPEAGVAPKRSVIKSTHGVRVILWRRNQEGHSTSEDVSQLKTHAYAFAQLRECARNVGSKAGF